VRTYEPDGTGHCSRVDCGRDVGAHYPGHEPKPCECAQCVESAERGGPIACDICGRHFDAPVHDVGRTLRCPQPLNTLQDLANALQQEMTDATPEET